MLGIGFGEMILLAGIALVIIGPERFPEFAKIVLRTVRDLRGYVEEAKRDIAEELRPVKSELQELARHNPEEYIDSLAGSISDAVDDTDDPDPSCEEPYAHVTDADENGGLDEETSAEDVDPEYDTGDSEGRLTDPPPDEPHRLDG